MDTSTNYPVRIKAVEPGGLQHGIDHCGPFTAGIGAQEQEIFPGNYSATIWMRVRCKGCKLPGDLPPLTASRQHVENCFNNHAQRYRAWPSAGRRRRHKRRYQRPFSIGKVACIAQLITAVLPPSGFSPGHCDSVSCRKPTESQPTEIAQLSFSFRF